MSKLTESEKEVLISQNYSLLKILACHCHKFSRNSYPPVDDLIWEGMTALTEAANHYDPDKGTKFSTYAGTCIKRIMMKAIYKGKDSTWSQPNNDDTIEKYPAGDSYSPDSPIISRESDEKLIIGLKNLSETERNVIAHRFGLDGNPSKTLDEISHLVGKSPEGVRQIQKTALSKLKQYVI